MHWGHIASSPCFHIPSPNELTVLLRNSNNAQITKLCAVVIICTRWEVRSIETKFILYSWQLSVQYYMCSSLQLIDWLISTPLKFSLLLLAFMLLRTEQTDDRLRPTTAATVTMTWASERARCEKVSMAEQTDFNCILSYKQLHKLATMKLNCLASYRLHDFDASVMQPKTIAFAPSHSIWWSPEKFKYTFFCFTTCRLSRYSIWLAQLRNCTQ